MLYFNYTLKYGLLRIFDGKLLFLSGSPKLSKTGEITSGRLSGIVAAVMLLVFILFASPLIERVPIAALVGVMFMVVIGTFAWSSFRIINKIPKKSGK